LSFPGIKKLGEMRKPCSCEPLKIQRPGSFQRTTVKFESYQKPDPVDMLISIIQVFGFADGSLSQEEEYLSNCPGIPWREEEFHRAAF
jgi:hypothetical protein